MKEFLLQYKNTITFTVEILAAVTGLIFFKKYKLTAAKYFIYFLVYLSICDYLGTFTLHVKEGGVLEFLQGTIFENNHWWTTSYWDIGAILFFSFFYYKILIKKWFKNIVKFSGIIFLIISIIYILCNWDEFFFRFFPIISILGGIIILFCSIFYFIEILTSDKVLTFYRTLNFYISVSIFIWWLITTPLIFYDIYNSNKDWNFIFLKWQIYLFANIIMYLTFTFALIWCKPEND